MYAELRWSATAPDGGWFAYAPLTDTAYSPGVNIDFWGLGVIFVGISTTVGAVNFIVTIFKCRAPGMTLNRMPIFVWSMLVFSFMVHVRRARGDRSPPALLELDRLFGTPFFDAGARRQRAAVPAPVLVLGPSRGVHPVHPRDRDDLDDHPGVLAPRARRLPVGRRPRSSRSGSSASACGCTTCSRPGSRCSRLSFFSAVEPRHHDPERRAVLRVDRDDVEGQGALHTPMLFAIGFLLIFLLGGITGVMVAVLPFDWQVTDSYFVVAHFHYVLNGAVVFPIFGALYYWLPKMTGRMLERAARQVELLDDVRRLQRRVLPDAHPRACSACRARVYTYDSGLGWDWLNLVVSIGGVRVRARHAAHVRQLRLEPAPRRARRRPDPWDADTLEWATDVAAARVQLRRDPGRREPAPALGRATAPASAAPGADDPRRACARRRRRAREASMPVTSGLDARPAGRRSRSPQPTYLAVRRSRSASPSFFVGLLIEAVVVGVARRRRRDRRRWCGGCGAPTTDLRDAALDRLLDVARPVAPPPVRRGYPTAWWGMVVAHHDRGDDLPRPAVGVLLPARDVAAVAAGRHRSRPSCIRSASSRSCCSGAASRSSGWSARSARAAGAGARRAAAQLR